MPEISIPVFILGTSLTAWACVRALKRERYVAILPWMLLLFAVLHGLGWVYYAATGGKVGGSTPFLDDELQPKARLGILISCAIGLVFLWLEKHVRGSHSLRRAATTTYEFAGRYVKWFFVAGILGNLAYLASPSGRVRSSYGIADIFISLSDSSRYYEARTEVSDAGTSRWVQTGYAVTVNTALPLATLVCLCAMLVTRDRIRRVYYGILWSIGLTAGFFSAMVGLNKYPFIQLLLSQVVVWGLWRGRSGISFGIGIASLAIGLGCIGALAVLYSATQGTEGLLELGSELGDRVLLIPTQASMAHFYVFPACLSFQHWSGSRTMHALLAPGTERYVHGAATCRLVSEVVFGSGYNINCGFIGDGWAQLGYLGIAQGAVIIFGIMTLVDLYARRSIPEVMRIPLVAFIIGGVGSIYSGDLMTVLLGSGVLTAPLLYRLLLVKKQPPARQAGAARPEARGEKRNSMEATSRAHLSSPSGRSAPNTPLLAQEGSSQPSQRI